MEKITMLHFNLATGLYVRTTHTTEEIKPVNGEFTTILEFEKNGVKVTLNQHLDGTIRKIETKTEVFNPANNGEEVPLITEAIMYEIYDEWANNDTALGLYINQVRKNYAKYHGL